MKSLFKNSIYNILYKVLNVIYPLVSATYVSHILQSNGVGKVAYVQNIAQYFVLLAALGLPNYGIKQIAKCQGSVENTNKAFSELFCINFFSTTVFVGLYYCLISTVDYFSDDWLLFAVAGLTIVFNYINVDWFFQGKEDYGYIALRSLLIKILSVVALFLFVKDKNNYIQYALIYSLAIGGNYIFNILRLRKYSGRLVLRGLNIKRHLLPVVILLSTSLSVEIYTLLDTTMLGYLCEESNVGYYTNSLKFVKVLISVITAIGGVLLPRLSYYYQKNELEKCSVIVNKVFKIMLYLFIPCFVGVILTSEYIIPIFFGDSFMPAVSTLKIASFLILVLGFGNLFSSQVLLTFDCEKKILICTICGAVSNFIMNSILIPSFQQNGAAIASVISETIVTSMTYLFARKYIRIKIKSIEIMSISIATFIMGIVVLIYKSYVNSNFAGLIGSVVIGAICYLGVSLLINPKMLNIIKLDD